MGRFGLLRGRGGIRGDRVRWLTRSRDVLVFVELHKAECILTLCGRCLVPVKFVPRVNKVRVLSDVLPEVGRYPWLGGLGS